MTETPDFQNCLIRYETPRLTLETLTRENMSPNYLHWVHDPEVTRYLEVRHTPQTQSDLEEFVDSTLVSGDKILFGIFLTQKGQHIGNLKIGPIHPRYARADIGLLLGDKDSWGKGYATEAIEGVCALSSRVLGLRRIQASTYASNTGSIRVFEKAGFQHEGRLEAHWILNDQPEDHLIFGKVLSK